MDKQVDDFRSSDLYKPCPHHANGNHSIAMDDYHPLGTQEIKQLLALASNSRSCQLTALIQVRLNQGIDGYVCPRSINGGVARLANKLDNHFVNTHEQGATPENVSFYVSLYAAA